MAQHARVARSSVRTVTLVRFGGLRRKTTKSDGRFTARVVGFTPLAFILTVFPASCWNGPPGSTEPTKSTEPTEPTEPTTERTEPTTTSPQTVSCRDWSAVYEETQIWEGAEAPRRWCIFHRYWKPEIHIVGCLNLACKAL